MKISIRLLYLYLFSFVGLTISVVGTIRIVDTTIRSIVFKNSYVYDYYYPGAIDCVEKNCEDYPSEQESMRIAKNNADREVERNISWSISMILVGLPLYLYHWKTIKKENK